MNIAAGMESDFSDYDCDIVYAEPKNTVGKSAKKRNNPDLEFVAVSKESVSNGTFKPIPEDRTKFSEKPNAEKNCYSNNRQQKWKSKRLVCQQSQPLDDLRYSIMQGNLEVTKAIIEKGIWVDSILKAGWTGLMYAASSARHEIVLYLLENKADPNYHKDMFTALMAACASSKEEADLYKCTCYLLQHGANVNVHERHLTTPLMFAAREGHVQIVEKLLQAGVNVDARDNKGQTALAWAACGGYGQIVRLLLNAGADAQVVDFCGQTAVDLAYGQGHKKIASVLEKSALQKPTESAEDAFVADNSPEFAPKPNQNLLGIVPSNSTAKLNKKFCTKQGDLELFLNGLGLPNMVAVFSDQHLTFTDLLVMSDEELEKIGINQIGIRKKILEASKAVHKKEWQNSSLPNLKQNQYISCADAVAMMANIAKHLNYISTTVVYVRQQIQSQPRILELAQDTANVHDLLDEMEDSLKNVHNLNDELRFFKLHLNKVQDNVRYIPADLIVETVPSANQKSKRTIVFGFVILSVTVGGIMWKKPSTLSHITSLILSKIPFIKGG